MLFCLISFLINTLVGLAYPIYSSLSLISNSRGSEKANLPDFQRWVSYWILYACILKFFCCDCCSENEYIDGFVTLVRSLVIVYLALPQTNGSFFVYEKVFKNGEETKEKIRGLVKGAIAKVCGCCKGKCEVKEKNIE